MHSVALALASALLLGVWQFALSIYRGKISVYAVILISASAAGVAYIILGALHGELSVNRGDLPEGLIGGFLNFVGTLLILKAFARGRIAIVAGVACAYVIVPLAYSLHLGEQITPHAALGLAMLLAGLGTFYAPQARLRPTADRQSTVGPVVMALTAALFWGVAIIILDLGTRDSITGTLTMSQIPQITACAVVLLATSTHSLKGISVKAIAVLTASGVALSLGNAAFFAAANGGDIGIVAVLSSLSPLVTAILAAIRFRERLAATERIAFAIVLAGAALVVA